MVRIDDMLTYFAYGTQRKREEGGCLHCEEPVHTLCVSTIQAMAPDTQNERAFLNGHPGGAWRNLVLWDRLPRTPSQYISSADALG